jgi:hypothetical protein
MKFLMKLKKQDYKLQVMLQLKQHPCLAAALNALFKVDLCSSISSITGSVRQLMLSMTALDPSQEQIAMNLANVSNAGNSC